MSSRMAGSEKVYEAAELWVERALKSDDSLFTPGEAIWSKKWLGVLRDHFLNRPNDSKGIRFYDKLRQQLENSPPQAYQLMGEILYVYYLIAFDIKRETKEGNIDKVLKWSSQDTKIPDRLGVSLTPGIAALGAGKGFILFNVGFLVEFVEQWKSKSESERKRLIEDPCAFKDFVMNIPLNSLLLHDNEGKTYMQRNALLHLVHPDTFEGIVATEHKELIANAKAFAKYIEEGTEDIDCKIQQIRQGIEKKKGAEFNTFYDPCIIRMWRHNLATS